MEGPAHLARVGPLTGGFVLAEGQKTIGTEA